MVRRVIFVTALSLVAAPVSARAISADRRLNRLLCAGSGHSGESELPTLTPRRAHRDPELGTRGLADRHAARQGVVWAIRDTESDWRMVGWYR